MVRIPLDMCVSDLKSPGNVYAPSDGKRLLLKKGSSLTEKTKELLIRNKVEYLEFPLPFEIADPPPFTFSEETETSLFQLVQTTYRAFKKDAVENPLDVRKEAYELITTAVEEFRTVCRSEHPMTDLPPSRNPRSVVHLRCVGASEDYLFEHAKNVCLTCVALGFDYFQDPKQLLSDLHKTGVAALFADIGMMKVPSRILKKGSELSDADWEKIHKHPETSAAFIETMFRQKQFVTVKIALEHHERGHKKGYPAKRLLPQIEPHSRLLAVADAYHSMISKRYFPPAIQPVDALAQINARGQSEFDERAVRTLNYRTAPYPIGSVATFSGDELVHVLELANTPTDFNKVRLLTSDRLYNIPRTIRSFRANPSSEPLSKMSIEGEVDKLGALVDTHDLLSLYGYILE
ncbi:MAG: HD domain-containing phosphohydrolase [bacterium]